MNVKALLATACMFGVIAGVGTVSATERAVVEHDDADSVDATSPAGPKVKAAGQPFEHPANDNSYTKDVQDDEHKMKAETSGNGSVQYISGGVGDGGMKTMQMQEKDYNLKLTFVAQGEYLADVNVNMTNGKGNSVLVTKTEGPVLLVKAPSGSYTIVAQDAAGTTLKKRIKVGNAHLTSYVLRYPDISND